MNPKYSKLLTFIFAYLLCFPIRVEAQNIQFVDSATPAGLTAAHFDGGHAKEYLPQLMMTGLALFDFDGDGWTDIYLLNGFRLSSATLSGRLPRSRGQPIDGEAGGGNTLYRNNRDGTFCDVTNKAGVASYAFAMGVVAGDFDNDGDQDLVTSNYGSIEFYLNNGDGTFIQVTKSLGIDTDKTCFGSGIAFLDIDCDGLLDLFASNYVEFSLDQYGDAPRSSPYPPGPKDFLPAADCLYHNSGDGTFENWSVASGITAAAGPSMGVVCGDFDGDNDADIFVCSDAAPNQLFVNDGNGHFVDQALLSGVAFDLSGNANGSMGVDAGDFDNDGRIDLLITNYTGQMPVLYRNLGNGLFEDVSRVTRVGRTVLSQTNWGVGLVDFDNDRDLDVFFANGHFLKNIASIDDRATYRATNTVMLNDGNGIFRDISKSSGAGLEILESSRGAGFEDMDRDGDIDCVVLNANSTPSFLENRTTGKGNWVGIRLYGTSTNRDGIGATVAFSADGQRQTAMVHAGRGYQSHYGSEIHFGLGRVEKVDEFLITWPGGQKEVFSCPKIGLTLRLVQGSGKQVND